MTEEIDIESKSEMRLCKYVLTFEAKLWSVITLPLIVFKYINWCIVGSVMRIVWIPALYYIYTYQLSPIWIMGSDGAIIVANRYPALYWSIIIFIIGVVGIMSTIYVIVEPNSDTVKYIKSKWMW